MKIAPRQRVVFTLLTCLAMSQHVATLAQSPAGNFDDVLIVGRPSLSGSSPSVPAGQVFDNDRVDVFDTLVPSVVRVGENVRLTNRSELNLFDGVSGDGITLVDSDANFRGGSVGDGFRITGDSTVNVFQLGAGNQRPIGSQAQIFSGSTLNLFDGSIGTSFGVNPGATVNVFGGFFQGGLQTVSEGAGRDPAIVNFVGGGVDALAIVNEGGIFNVSDGDFEAAPISLFRANNGGVINISGGAFRGAGNIGSTRLVEANRGSIVNITGGQFLPVPSFSGTTRLTANSGSEFNFFGTEFRIDGVLIDMLPTDQPQTIADRDVVLSGILSDGSPFSFDLISDARSQTARDFFAVDSIVTITRTIPEPASLLLLAIGVGSLSVIRHKVDRIAES